MWPSRRSINLDKRRVGLHVVLFEVVCYTEGFSHFVTSMTAPVASGLERSPGGSHPLESAAFSRRTREADIADPAADVAVEGTAEVSHVAMLWQRQQIQGRA
jgi:hypothetical protein